MRRITRTQLAQSKMAALARRSTDRLRITYTDRHHWRPADEREDEDVRGERVRRIGTDALGDC